MPTDLDRLTQTFIVIKQQYEDAIRRKEKTERIRGQRIIGFLHTYVIEELKRNGIPTGWIQTNAVIQGFPKKKEQDILVEPPGGIVTLKRRKVHVGPLMSVNIRSQLSSIEKNYDTLYERLFAEALNIHNQFPHMVLGYVYLIPLVGYGAKLAAEGNIDFTEQYDLEKYIVSFDRINNRASPTDEPWKYERMCFLVIDFESSPPKIVEDNQYLIDKKRITKDFASLYNLSSLSVSTFFDDIVTILKQRYYELFKV